MKEGLIFISLNDDLAKFIEDLYCINYSIYGFYYSTTINNNKKLNCILFDISSNQTPTLFENNCDLNEISTSLNVNNIYIAPIKNPLTIRNIFINYINKSSELSLKNYNNILEKISNDTSPSLLDTSILQKSTTNILINLMKNTGYNKNISTLPNIPISCFNHLRLYSENIKLPSKPLKNHMELKNCFKKIINNFIDNSDINLLFKFVQPIEDTNTCNHEEKSSENTINIKFKNGKKETISNSNPMLERFDLSELHEILSLLDIMNTDSNDLENLRLEITKSIISLSMNHKQK